MGPHRARRRRPLLESLEGRIALSHMGVAVEDGTHHHRGGHAEVRALRHGADDAAKHDATDDHGGQATASNPSDDPASHDASHRAGGLGEVVHQHRGGTTGAPNRRGHHGAHARAGHR